MSAALALVVGAVSGLALYLYCSSQKDGGRARSGIDPLTGESMYSQSNRMETLRNKVPTETNESSGWGTGSQAQRDFAMSNAEREFATSQAQQDFATSQAGREFRHTTTKSSRTRRSRSRSGHDSADETKNSRSRSGHDADETRKSQTEASSASAVTDPQSPSGKRVSKKVTTYCKETYDRNVVRSRTTPQVDHSPLPQMEPRSDRRDNDAIKPIKNPQVHTYHDSVDEKHVDRGFQRSEKSEEHMEKETHNSTVS
ncbi:hypothetical protein TELCIR_09465 [Teladorsagia circumcincta]|uniref:Uncharacterized protein n=1 Tax=Teladorsagia circumcincta TaxID=45464 RepID=A0A2G9UEP2_TELCI|nr:hypothetical protein TELCIR_09465 [Teladorsagia circumcincta]